MNVSNFNPDDADYMNDANRKHQAIARTRKLLEEASASPDSFPAPRLHATIRVLLAVSCSGVQPRDAVAQVLIGLTARERKRLRSSLLKFYVREGALTEASKYLLADGKLAISEYEPAMCVHLANGDLKAAESIARRCEKVVPVNATALSSRARSFTELGLHTALGDYHAHTGQRNKAMDFWQYPNFLGDNYAGVITGMTYGVALEALRIAYRGIDDLLYEQVQEQSSSGKLSGSDASENRLQVIETLSRLHGRLQQILLPARRDGLRQIPTRHASDDARLLEKYPDGVVPPWNCTLCKEMLSERLGPEHGESYLRLQRVTVSTSGWTAFGGGLSGGAFALYKWVMRCDADDEYEHHRSVIEEWHAQQVRRVEEAFARKAANAQLEGGASNE